ncbi:MAG: hypothetical protein OXG81_13615 [Acidobacteria bacterium]|nr:hypothetical protein [Acidobacteriota bacterium]MCY4122961.1 hypothetical protein [Acidobacteriota bacterium]
MSTPRCPNTLPVSNESGSRGGAGSSWNSAGFPRADRRSFPEAVGHLPGLTGRLNPKRDAADRTYLYADNIAIEQGRQQPVSFRLGSPLRLTDAFGFELNVTVVDIVGRAALVEYRQLRPDEEQRR